MFDMTAAALFVNAMAVLFIASSSKDLLAGSILERVMCQNCVASISSLVA